MAGKTGRPTLSPDQAARVHAALVRLRDDRFKGNQAELARAIGIKPPSLHAIMEKHNAPSYPTCIKIAALLGMHVDVLLGGGTTRTIIDPRYPNQDLAAEVFRREAAAKGISSELAEQAIEEARAAVHDLPHDATPLEWVDHFKAVASAIRFTRANPDLEAQRAAADAARAREMEDVTRPKLPKRAPR